MDSQNIDNLELCLFSISAPRQCNSSVDLRSNVYFSLNDRLI